MTARRTASLPLRPILNIAVVAAVALLWLHSVAPAHANGPCRSERFEGMGYVVCSFDPAGPALRLFWRDNSGRPYRPFSALASALERHRATLTFAMNAGMFLSDFTPLGLHVEDGHELRPVRTANAPASARPVPNFYK